MDSTQSMFTPYNMKVRTIKVEWTEEELVKLVNLYLIKKNLNQFKFSMVLIIRRN